MRKPNQQIRGAGIFPPNKRTDAMTHMEITALENAGNSAKAWTPEGYDGHTHYASLLIAFMPAVLILAIATYLLQAIF
jgi:hypothetical protein